MSIAARFANARLRWPATTLDITASRRMARPSLQVSGLVAREPPVGTKGSERRALAGAVLSGGPTGVLLVLEDDATRGEGELNGGVRKLGHRCLEQVPVEYGEVGALADLDRTGLQVVVVHKR